MMILRGIEKIEREENSPLRPGIENAKGNEEKNSEEERKERTHVVIKCLQLVISYSCIRTQCLILLGQMELQQKL